MSIAERLLLVREQIANAAVKAGREPSEIQLLAVSKTKPAEMVVEAVQAGQTMFGENKLQGAPEKIDRVAELLLPENPRPIWHFIGHLQSNKVRKVLEQFSFVQSLDSAKLVDRVERIAGEMGIAAHGLLQVNIAEADSQFGFPVDDVMEMVEACAEYSSLHIDGLMAIGPNTDDEVEIASAFASVRKLAEKIESQHIANVSMKTLSLGMTDDMEIAIAEGSTMVRVGTAIFGPRNY